MIVGAIVDLLTAMVGGSTAIVPSKVREALDLLKKLDSKDRLWLALKHGRLGTALTNAAETLVQHSHNDMTSAAVLDTSLGQLSEWLDGPDGGAIDGLLQALRDDCSTLRLWTSIGLMENMEKLAEFCKKLGFAIDREQTRLVLDSVACVAPISEALLGAFEADLKGEASEESNAPLGNEHMNKKAAERIKECVVAASGVVEAWCALNDFGERCASFQSLLNKAASSIKQEIECNFAAVVAKIGARRSALDNLITVCKSTSALAPEMSSISYQSALQEWSQWSSATTSSGEVCKVEVKPRPYLQQLMDASRAASELRASAASADIHHECSEAVELMRFSTSRVPDAMLKMFQSKVGHFLADSLKAARASLFTDGLALVSEDRIQAYSIGSDTSTTGLMKMLIKGQRTGASTAEALDQAILLATAGKTECVPCEWPHHSPVQMAKHCASLMDTDGNEARGSKARTSLTLPPPIGLLNLVCAACAHTGVNRTQTSRAMSSIPHPNSRSTMC